MKKVTITNAKGVGVLTRDDNPKDQWSIEINGRQGGSLYYSTPQVEKIVKDAQARGDKVEIE